MSEKLKVISDRFPDGWWPDIDTMAGWDDLILDIHASIIAIDPDYVPVQVKEKFGGLRYNIEYSSDWAPEQREAINKIIREGEKKSYTICEVCGQAGLLRDGNTAPKSTRTHRLLTLCEQHKDASPWDYSEKSFEETLTDIFDKHILERKNE